jgi:hypothetical protein
MKSSVSPLPHQSARAALLGFKPLRCNLAGRSLNETPHARQRFTQPATISPDPRCFDVTRACHSIQVF